MSAPKQADTAGMDEAAAKSQLDDMQKQYSTLVVTFNNQQTELQTAQSRIADLETELAAAKTVTSTTSTVDEKVSDIKGLLDNAQNDIKRLELENMNLQKKVNALQVEHVSEEEVDQLFYALEQKEQALEMALAEKETMEGELLTARQMSARGGGAEPKFIEIHHHADMSDGDDDEKDGEPKPVS